MIYLCWYMGDFLEWLKSFFFLCLYYFYPTGLALDDQSTPFTHTILTAPAACSNCYYSKHWHSDTHPNINLPSKHAKFDVHLSFCNSKGMFCKQWGMFEDWGFLKCLDFQFPRVGKPVQNSWGKILVVSMCIGIGFGNGAKMLGV